MIQIVAWAAGITSLGAMLGVVYQVLGTRKDARVYPPPGRLLGLGSHRLHLLESGRGSPTIVLEAGLMSTVLSWSDLQRELAGSFRVVSYDRAGLGLSDIGPMPRTADRIVDELHTLLERATIPPPYVLVGHSFGGLTMPLFAARFPDEVAGIVLVDPVAPAEWNPPSEHDLKLTRIGANVCRRAALLARFGLIRFVAFLLTTGGKKAGVIWCATAAGRLPTLGPFRVPGFRHFRQLKKPWRPFSGFSQNLRLRSPANWKTCPLARPAPANLQIFPISRW